MSFEWVGRGGARAGAGRPRAGARRLALGTRGAIASRHPVHVTLRCVDGFFLRRWDVFKLVCDATSAAHVDEFRICELDLEPNHLHLILEVAGAEDLASGLQRFQSVLARRLNALARRSGQVFLDRYHSTVLTSPTQVKHALRYVLNNRRHHAADACRRLPDDWFDPYSSAAWFTGWDAPLIPTSDEHRAAIAMPCPTATPKTWLLAVGWRRLGLLSVAEIPGGTRRLEQHEDELAHRERMMAIDLERRTMRGELIVLDPDV